MTEFEIAVAGEQAQLLASRGQLTYRMAGAQVRFSFDEEWNALTPYALVRQGDAAVAIPMEGNTAIIPGHALTMVGDFVYAGVYGVSADGLIAIPTVWVRLGRLRDGAHIFYDGDTLPNTPIWQTLGAQMGDISQLQTPEKTNLVDAVNSVAAGSREAIPAPQTATPGQTLAVKAVDEKGRPTEWETANRTGGSPFHDDWGEPVATLTLDEEVYQFKIDTTDDGRSLSALGAKEILVSYQAASSTTATSRFMSGSAWIGNAFAGGQSININNAASKSTWETPVTWFYGAVGGNMKNENGVYMKLVTAWDGSSVTQKQLGSGTAAAPIGIFSNLGFTANASDQKLGVGTAVKVWVR